MQPHPHTAQGPGVHGEPTSQTADRAGLRLAAALPHTEEGLAWKGGR